MRFEGRSAIVTGGARGIASPSPSAGEGRRQVIMDRAHQDGGSTDHSAGEEAVAKIRAAGGSALLAAESVADHEACGRTVALCAEKFGSVDILVNNAGVLRPKMIWNMPVEDWDVVVDIHLRGQYSMIHHAAPHMRRQRWGRIVNMGSEAWRGTVGGANYGAAKGGVFSLTRAMARELGKYGVTANTVCRPRPPPHARRAVKEGFRKRLEAGLVTKERYDAVVNMGGPEHIARSSPISAHEAANINRPFRAEDRKIGIYNEPELKASVVKAGDEPFTQDEIRKLVPSALLGGYVNPARPAPPRARPRPPAPLLRPPP